MGFPILVHLYPYLDFSAVRVPFYAIGSTTTVFLFWNGSLVALVRHGLRPESAIIVSVAGQYRPIMACSRGSVYVGALLCNRCDRVQCKLLQTNKHHGHNTQWLVVSWTGRYSHPQSQMTPTYYRVSPSCKPNNCLIIEYPDFIMYYHFIVYILYCLNIENTQLSFASVCSHISRDCYEKEIPSWLALTTTGNRSLTPAHLPACCLCLYKGQW